MLGSPISHSLSPALHRAAYAALGLDWTYEAIEVTEAGLEAFVAALDDSWAGLSLTMPLKERAVRLCADVDDAARAISSVNTLLPVADGWRGTNTDIHGIIRSLRDVGIDGPLGTGLVLGAGATARSAVAALAAIGIAELKVAARREEAAHELVELAASMGLSAHAVDWQPHAEALEVDLVVSTLPGDAGSGWAQLAGRARGALLDAAYHPWPTPLAAAWPNGRVASGRSMLLWQAVEQVRLMTGLEPPVEAMRASLG